MLRGLPASVVLHAAVLASGYIVLPGLHRNLETVYTVIPIDVVSVSEVPDIAPRLEREPEKAEPEIEPPPLEEFLEDLETVPDETLPEDEPLAPDEVAPPPPEPEPVLLPDEDTETPEPDEPDTPPEPEKPEIVQPEPETNELEDFLGEASNLFDKTPREPQRAPPKAQKPEPEIKDEEPAPSKARKGAGDRRGNATSVVAMIQSQMNVCWDSVDDLPNPERLNVTLSMQLNRDGTLKRDARLVRPARIPIGDRPMQVAIERALRAARKCAPYRLPEDAQDYYDDWDEVTLNIGPAYK